MCFGASGPYQPSFPKVVLNTLATAEKVRESAEEVSDSAEEQRCLFFLAEKLAHLNEFILLKY